MLGSGRGLLFLVWFRHVYPRVSLGGCGWNCLNLPAPGLLSLRVRRIRLSVVGCLLLMVTFLLFLLMGVLKDL